MQRLSYREMAHVKLNNRLRELLVLVLLIVAGVLISVSVNAQPQSKKFHKQEVYSKNACMILKKKGI